MKSLNILMACALALAPAVAVAQEWPTKPVTIVVPFAPGGTTDITGRILANQLSTATGQPFLVENRAGGGGAVGATSVARAPADGYTLLFGSSGTFAVNQHLYANLEYDVEEDFDPISQITQNRAFVFVGGGSDINTIEELFERIKANPGTVTFSSAGIGSGTHLAAEAILAAAGLDAVHIPYPSAGAGALAVTAGEVDFGVDALGSTLSFFQNGSLKPLAVSTLDRDPLLSEVPTLDETVAKDFVNVSWLAMVVPAGVPDDIKSSINKVLVETLNAPDTAELFAKQGIDPQPSTPDELAQLITADAAMYGELIRANGITPQ